jgi:glycosyltransferase involved in cell wall biosynthesis
MHILILNWRDPSNPKSGGAEVVTLEIAKEWIRKGYEVTWYSSRFKGSSRTAVIEEIKVVRYGNSFFVYLLAPFFYLLNRHKFDLIIDQIHGLPFLTPLYVRKPKIVIIHEVAGEIWDIMYPFPFSKVGKLAELIYFIFYRKTKFLVPSKSTRAELYGKGISKKNVTLFYCGINNMPVQKFAKEKYPTFIFVNRLVKMKGIENVLNAFPYILKSIPNAKLWVVGGGAEIEVKRLKKIVSKNRIKESVTFFGRVSEEKKYELMRRAHIMLHASVKEGWGLVVIEAAGQMTPSVVYNVNGLRDSVKNGKTGIVIEENTPKSLASNAYELIKNKSLYNKLQKDAYVWSKTFTWENCAKPSLKLIKQLTSHQKHS